MDPATAIVAALSAGAIAIANGALQAAGEDAYKSLKTALLGVVAPGRIADLEAKPDSEGRKAVVAEELAAAGKAEDPELAGLAQALVAALKAEGAVAATGVSLEEVEAVNIRLQRIAASGTGASLKKTTATGDIEISDVTAGQKPGKA